jgi:polysaccharide export outer membrane protein
MTLALLVSGCSPGASLPPLPAYNGAHYQLGVGDQVRLLTFGVEQLSGTFRINDSGNIELPLVGSFHAAGQSTSELRDALAAELESRKLLRSPSVSVEVLEYRPIFVLGEVNRPGQYPYQPGMKMLTAVAVAGGFTYRAVQDRVQVLRSTDSPPFTGRADLDAYVAPADVITVLERYF